MGFDVTQAWDRGLSSPAPNTTLALHIENCDLLTVPFSIRADVAPAEVVTRTVSFFNVQVGTPPLQHWNATVRPAAAQAWLTLSKNNGTVGDIGSSDTLTVVVNASGAPAWRPAQEEEGEVCLVTDSFGATESCVDVKMHVAAGPAVVDATTPWQFVVDSTSSGHHRIPHTVSSW